MQTFLPYADYYKSANCLDNKRLGKQRVEVLQILNTLSGTSKGWNNHPIVKMWRGYEAALIEYGIAICDEWRLNRGFKDTIKVKIENIAPSSIVINPPWLGNEEFHRSHRSNLLRKLPSHYSKFGWDVPDNLPYYWIY